MQGHKAGSASVREIVEASARLGIACLTLYAFSSENWKRPRYEVGSLWRLLRENLGKELSLLIDNDIRLKVIGRREGIPAAALKELERVEALTRENRRMTLIFALNYGGRGDIVDAAKRIMAEGRHLRLRASTRRPSPPIFRPRASPTRTCSSGRAARCGYRTSSSGRSPTPRSS